MCMGNFCPSWAAGGETIQIQTQSEDIAEVQGYVAMGFWLKALSNLF